MKVSKLRNIFCLVTMSLCLPVATLAHHNDDDHDDEEEVLEETITTAEYLDSEPWNDYWEDFYDDEWDDPLDPEYDEPDIPDPDPDPSPECLAHKLQYPAHCSTLGYDPGSVADNFPSDQYWDNLLSSRRSAQSYGSPLWAYIPDFLSPYLSRFEDAFDQFTADFANTLDLRSAGGDFWEEMGEVCDEHTNRHEDEVQCWRAAMWTMHSIYGSGTIDFGSFSLGYENIGWSSPSISMTAWGEGLRNAIVEHDQCHSWYTRNEQLGCDQ